MKSSIFVVIISLFSGSAAFSAQTVEIFTYDTLPPFAYRDKQGNLTGIYVEIVKKAVSRMPDYSLRLKVVPWARAKTLAENGEAFAILPPYFHAHDWLTATPPRRPYIWPYSMPLYSQHDVVICNKDALTRPRKKFPEDYKKLKFVMWRGDGRAGTKFTRMVNDGEIDLHLVNDVKATILYLLAKRAECTVADKAAFDWYVRKMKESGEYQKYGEKTALKEAALISINDGYLGYTDIDAEKRFPFKKDFSIKFDIEVYKMKQSGEIKDIVSRLRP